MSLNKHYLYLWMRILLTLLIENWKLYETKQIFPLCFSVLADKDKTNALKKSKSIDRARYENSCYATDDDDNIVFEDFARLRLNEPDE